MGSPMQILEILDLWPGSIWISTVFYPVEKLTNNYFAFYDQLFVTIETLSLNFSERGHVPEQTYTNTAHTGFWPSPSCRSTPELSGFRADAGKRGVSAPFCGVQVWRQSHDPSPWDALLGLYSFQEQGDLARTAGF